MTIDIIQGDCLDVLLKLDHGGARFDMVFADPPFNIGKKYESINDRRKDYYEWCETWVELCWRLLKPTGTFCLMTMPIHLAKMLSFMLPYQFVNIVNWRNVSASRSVKNFWTTTLPIIIYGKSDEYKFNRYAQTRQLKNENLRWGGYNTEPKGQLLDYWDDIPFVFSGSSCHPEAILVPGTNRKVHPCQMPVDVPKRLIMFLTDKGDSVLDPFIGSGSTAVACASEGRNCTGIDISEEYCQMSRKRVEDEQQKVRLF